MQLETGAGPNAFFLVYELLEREPGVAVTCRARQATPEQRRPKSSKGRPAHGTNCGKNFTPPRRHRRTGRRVRARALDSKMLQALPGQVVEEAADSGGRLPFSFSSFAALRAPPAPATADGREQRSGAW